MKIISFGILSAFLISCFNGMIDAGGIKGSTHMLVSDFTPTIVHVALFEMTTVSNILMPLTKRRVLGGDNVPGDLPSSIITIATEDTKTSNLWNYAFNEVPVGNYSVMAFSVSNTGKWLDFSQRQALGFFVPKSGCSASSFSNTVCTQPVFVDNQIVTIDSIGMAAPHMLPSMPQTVKVGNGYGSLTKINGLPVLEVGGTAYERGYAHGFLLSTQILDIFEYFLLEDMVRSQAFYTDKFIPALKSLVILSPQLKDGINGLLDGMKATNISMQTSLGRNLISWDIVAINTYADAIAFTGEGSRVVNDMCTQFVFWGDATKKTGSITGRNMDGENDVRKLTVNLFLIHAINPSEKELSRYVHVMWPGFLAASSGFNENGFYTMENAGCNPPGIAGKNTYLLRDIISSLLLTTSSGPHTGKDMQNAILSYASKPGGSCVNGCILMMAQRDEGQNEVGFLYEGDRYGGKIRMPAEVAPFTQDGIMATNHYWSYHANPPQDCNGQTPSFSSLWRYEAGKDRIEGLMSSVGLSVRTNEMISLLQTVVHGTTEHSVIFLPNELKFHIAVANSNGLWEAPYMHWTEFHFSEVFQHKE